MAVASLGLSFSAASIIKKTCLVMINVILMGFGAACTVLSIYQVKLLPQSFTEFSSNYPAVSVEEDLSEINTQLNVSHTNSVPAYSVLSPFFIEDVIAIPSSPTLPTLGNSLESTEPPQTIATKLSSTPVKITSTPSSQTTTTTNEAAPTLARITTTTSVDNKATTLPTVKTVPSYPETSTVTMSVSTSKSFSTISTKVRLRFPRSVTSVATKARVLTNSGVPAYFEEIFSLIVASLYVCMSCGIVILLSALVGLCGGLCRVAACLKCGVAGTVLVMLAELVSTAFIFVAHDKLVNKKSNSTELLVMLNFLCSEVNFCINPMILVLIGSFTSICLIFQVGSITMSCKLIQDTQDEFAGFEESYYPNQHGYRRRGRRNYPAHCLTGHPMNSLMNSAYTTPMVPGGNFFPMMQMPPAVMMPQAMGYPPVQPQMRPIINIIS